MSQKDRPEEDLLANFLVANEFLDFIEFLQNELGFDDVRELQEKFEKWQESGKQLTP